MRNISLLTHNAMHKAEVCILVSLTLAPLLAQRRTPGQPDNPSVPDIAHIQASVVREYDSITDLYSASDLVVQVHVKSVLPTQDLSTNPRTHNLLTAAVVTVTHTFKGSANQVAVAQAGGVQGNRQRIPDQYHLLQMGEDYVLFLTRDQRLQSLAPADIPVYSVTGAWAGLFQIVNNTLKLSPAAHQTLHERYEAQTLDVLMADLRTLPQ